MAAERVGAAKRRRDRQLRAFRRHELLTVRMELAAALHHSAQPAGPVVAGPREVEEQDKYEASRRQKAPPPGAHPGVLKEPEVQLVAATVGYVAASTPRLVVVSLAGCNVVDTTTCQYILQYALRRRQEKEEEERRKKEEKEKEEAKRALDEFFSSPWALAAEARGSQEKKEEKRRRKKQKRRKKKTPKTSSSACRMVRLPWRCHELYGVSVLGSEHCANFVLDCACSWSYGVKLATSIRTWWRTRAVLPSMLAGFAG